MSDMRLIVAGAGGRMGRTLIKAIADSKELTLVGAIDPVNNTARQAKNARMNAPVTTQQNFTAAGRHSPRR